MREFPRTRRPALPRSASVRISDARSRSAKVRARCCARGPAQTGWSRSEGGSAIRVSMATATELEVRRAATSDPAAASLLQSYAQEIEERFVERPASRVETAAAEYLPPGGTFLVAYEGDRPIACAGIRALPDGAGEIKRMYVVPDVRGRGVGRQL